MEDDFEEEEEKEDEDNAAAMEIDGFDKVDASNIFFILLSLVILLLLSLSYDTFCFGIG